MAARERPPGCGVPRADPESRFHSGYHLMALLTATGISKHFAGVQALKAVSFELRAREVHALVGENGAGKSTLIKVITGAVKPDAGTLTVDGQPVPHNSPAIAHALGIAAVYQ